MILLPLVALLWTTAAADDAGWPCEAPAAPLSAPAAYWPDVARPAAAGWSSDASVVALTRSVTRRSLDEAEAVAQVRQFAATRGGKDDRAKLAAAMIDGIDGERRTIINGIQRFNGRQAQLAKRIEEDYSALDTNGPALTAERRAAVEEQARWDQRIFEDRQRMLPIICRQPAALERRLAALLAALK